MDLVVIVLRLLHIVSGVLWVGAAFAFFLYVVPSSKALGPDRHGAFIEQMIKVRRFPRYVITAGAITVLAGAALYWIDSDGFTSAWLRTPTGIGFSIGAVAGIASFALGPVAIAPTIAKLEAVGDRLKAEGRPPTPEEGATLQALDRRMTTIGRVDLVLLSVAVAFMATSRYFG